MKKKHLVYIHYSYYGYLIPIHFISFQVPIIENNVCEEMFDQGGHKKKILPSFLCAGYANGQKDSCEVGYISVLLVNTYC